MAIANQSSETKGAVPNRVQVEGTEKVRFDRLSGEAQPVAAKTSSENK